MQTRDTYYTRQVRKTKTLTKRPRYEFLCELMLIGCDTTARAFRSSDFTALTTPSLACEAIRKLTHSWSLYVIPSLSRSFQTRRRPLENLAVDFDDVLTVSVLREEVDTSRHRHTSWKSLLRRLHNEHDDGVVFINPKVWLGNWFYYYYTIWCFTFILYVIR